MKIKNRVAGILLPLLIVASGFGVMKFLELSRNPPARKPAAHAGVLVEVTRPVAGPYTVRVRGTGVVRPQREISVIPQVSGVVKKISDRFVQGGRFSNGEVMFSLEDVDYRLALAQAQATLARARLNLTIEKTRGGIALEDLENIGGDISVARNPLVLRKPQMQEAQAAMSAAEAAVRQAEINLERTVIRAPFNAVVRQEQVELGQYVRAGSVVGELFGTDVAEVIVPVPLDEIEWIHIPGPDGRDVKGSSVRVQKEVNRHLHEWHGKVSRILGSVEPRGRMARLVVNVPAPFLLRDDLKNICLYEGMFVDVVVEGVKFAKVFSLPAGALRDNSTVWIMDDSGRLQVRKIELLRVEDGMLVIRAGVTEEDMVVLTDINGAAPGMLIRTSALDSKGHQL